MKGVEDVELDDPKAAVAAVETAVSLAPNCPVPNWNKLPDCPVLLDSLFPPNVKELPAAVEVTAEVCPPNVKGPAVAVDVIAALAVWPNVVVDVTATLAVWPNVKGLADEAVEVGPKLNDGPEEAVVDATDEAGVEFPKVKELVAEVAAETVED